MEEFMAEQPQPNVANSLLAIHMVVTRGLSVALQYTAKYAQNGFPDDTTRLGFASYLQALEQVLSSHHLAEDELGFPYFQKLVPEAPYSKLSAQHQEMLPFLSQIKTSSETIKSAEEQNSTFEKLISALQQINQIWHPHIAIEEEHLAVDKLANLMPVDEHLRLIKEMGEYSQQHSGPVYLVIPFILYNLPPGPRAAMQNGLPSEVTSNLVPVLWKERWAPMKPYLLE
jgi:hemerythrin-like domain-containing protein